MVVNLFHHCEMFSSVVSGTHDCDTKKNPLKSVMALMFTKVYL